MEGKMNTCKIKKLWFVFHTQSTQSTPKYHYLKDIKRDTLMMLAFFRGSEVRAYKMDCFW